MNNTLIMAPREVAEYGASMRGRRSTGAGVMLWLIHSVNRDGSFLGLNFNWPKSEDSYFDAAHHRLLLQCVRR